MSDESGDKEKIETLAPPTEQLGQSVVERAARLVTDVASMDSRELLEQATSSHASEQSPQRKLTRRGDDVDDVIEACDQLGHAVRSSGNKIADALAEMGTSIRLAGDQINDACQESGQTIRKFSNLLGDTLIEAAERAAESSTDDDNDNNDGES